MVATRSRRTLDQRPSTPPVSTGTIPKRTLSRQRQSPKRTRRQQGQSQVPFAGFSNEELDESSRHVSALSRSRLSLDIGEFQPPLHSTCTSSVLSYILPVHEEQVTVHQEQVTVNQEQMNEEEIDEENLPTIDIDEEDLPGIEMNDMSDPGVVNESEMEIAPPEPLPYQVGDPNAPVTYYIMPNANQKGGDLLVASDGREYTLKKDKRRTTVDYKCAVGKCGKTCKVYVRNGKYIRNKAPHIHPALYNPEKIRSIRIQIKENAIKNPYKSNTRFATHTLLKEIPISERCLCTFNFPIPVRAGQQGKT